jgi:quercetin dioxygenase-like cupin family protein
MERIMDLSTPRLFRWDDIAAEPVTDSIRRKVITGEHAMMAQIWLDAGCVVPQHSHEAEQISWVFSGALKFVIDGETIDVRSGDVLIIPSGVPHEAVALEDTWEMDSFAPIRHDWLDGTDSYFTGPQKAAKGFSNPASASNPARLVRWDGIVVEPITSDIDRRFATGDRETLAELILRKGCVVPQHSHVSEQLTWVRAGALELDLSGTVYTVPGGSVLRIPGGLPHMATALEDTRVIDLFGPRRDDWLAGSDQYLRQAKVSR